MDLVALLQAISTGPVSGQALASSFSVSRTMVWKGVEALRAEGLGIDTQGGYHLASPTGYGPTTLAWRAGRPVHFVPSCASTNRLAQELAEGEPGVDHVVVADHQTGGRGRLGRQWESPAGQNLLVSFVRHPEVSPADAPRCVLVWAAAVAQALDLRLKWPNDLVDTEGHKVGGFLAELEAGSEPFGGEARVRHVVLGLGLNVNQERFPDELSFARSLRQLRGYPLDRAALLGRIVRALDAVDPSAPDALELWRERAHTLGRRVRVGEVEGIAQALREDGALVIDGQAVLTGDVELVAPAPAAPAQA